MNLNGSFECNQPVAIAKHVTGLKIEYGSVSTSKQKLYFLLEFSTQIDLNRTANQSLFILMAKWLSEGAIAFMLSEMQRGDIDCTLTGTDQTIFDSVDRLWFTHFTFNIFNGCKQIRQFHRILSNCISIKYEKQWEIDYLETWIWSRQTSTSPSSLWMICHPKDSFLWKPKRYIYASIQPLWNELPTVLECWTLSFFSLLVNKHKVCWIVCFNENTFRIILRQSFNHRDQLTHALRRQWVELLVHIAHTSRSSHQTDKKWTLRFFHANWNVYHHLKHMLFVYMQEAGSIFFLSPARKQCWYEWAVALTHSVQITHFNYMRFKFSWHRICVEHLITIRLQEQSIQFMCEDETDVNQVQSRQMCLTASMPHFMCRAITRPPTS